MSRLKNHRKIIPLEGEVFRDFEGKKISNLGRAFNEFGKQIGLVKRDPKNRNYVKIWHNKTHYSLHRLIYTLFIGIIPEGMEINHIDGDKLNNKVNNLEALTPTENMRHAIRIGLKGGKPKKFTEEEIDLAFSLFKEGYSDAEINRKTNISRCYLKELR